MSDFTSTVEPRGRKKEVSTRKRGWDLKLGKALGQNRRTRDTVCMVQVQRGPGGCYKMEGRLAGAQLQRSL